MEIDPNTTLTSRSLIKRLYPNTFRLKWAREPALYLLQNMGPMWPEETRRQKYLFLRGFSKV